MYWIITCVGGRAPPGQNTPRPYAESHSLDAAPQPRAPTPLRAHDPPAPRSCADPPLPPLDSPTCAMSVSCSRSCWQSTPSLPSVKDDRALAAETAAPHAHALQPSIELAFPSLHPLK